MNEQLQIAVTALINKSILAFQAGADFLSAEIPDVVHQLLLWKMTISALSFTAFVVLAIAAIIVDVKLFKKARELDRGYGDATILGWGLCGSLVRVIGWLSIGNLFSLTWLQILIAPKIFLIEYAASLVK